MQTEAEQKRQQPSKWAVVREHVLRGSPHTPLKGGPAKQAPNGAGKFRSAPNSPACKGQCTTPSGTPRQTQSSIARLKARTDARSPATPSSEARKNHAMPSIKSGTRTTGPRVAATPDRSNSRIGREGSTESVGRPVTRRQSVGVQPASAMKRPTTATPSRRSSAVGGGSAKDRVTCIVRKRPAKDGEIDVVNVVDTAIVQVAEPKQKVDLTRYTENHQFVFDHAFCEESRNEEVYNCSTKPLVNFVVDGGMGTCFAFGQTGSGKTFTMLGAPEAGQRGLYLLAADDMFRMCESNDQGIGIFISMMEIYGDEVFDLLSRDKKKLVPREDAKKKVQIAGLTEFAVHSSEELMMAIEEGSQVSLSLSLAGSRCPSSISFSLPSLPTRVVPSSVVYYLPATSPELHSLALKWPRCGMCVCLCSCDQRARRV